MTAIDAINATIIMLLAAYFLPTLIAALRRHRSFGGIFILNLLLGWTFLGWIIALIWSFAYAGDRRPQAQVKAATRPIAVGKAEGLDVYVAVIVSVASIALLAYGLSWITG